MQILNIIFTIVAVIANAAVTYFAIAAWFGLRRMKSGMDGMKRALAVTTTITIGDHVRDNFEQLNEMRAVLRRLVEDEHYEEAKELEKDIRKMEHHAEESLRHFKEICGDKLCDIVVTKVKAGRNEEETE